MATEYKLIGLDLSKKVRWAALECLPASSNRNPELEHMVRQITQSQGLPERLIHKLQERSDENT